MLTVALTGGIGCGKTTVSNLFADLGTPVIDTDLIARDLVEPGNLALEEISSYFGAEILHQDGTLDRKALAKITFSSAENRKQLESILHPKIRHIVKQQIDLLNSLYVIIAIPLLIETAQTSSYDRVLVVDCEEQQQIQRTLERDNRSKEEIDRIINAQVNRHNRIKHANDVISNDSDISSLTSQVSNLHRLYNELARKTS